jgi:transcriptional regulator with XRE-family HTH domain
MDFSKKCFGGDMKGSQLKAARLEKRIKQKALAAYAGIYQTDLSAFEAERRSVKEEALIKLQEGLQVIPLLRHDELVELEATAR